MVCVRDEGLFESTATGAAGASLLVRIYATVRHFARWLHRKFDPLPAGLSHRWGEAAGGTHGRLEGPHPVGELRLLNAVQTLRVRRGTGTDQGLRNHALLAALLGSGLRVSEMVHLERDQYTGKGFTCVQTKGGVIRDCVPLHRDARQVLDAWLTARQDASPALFLTRTGRKLSRREAYGIIQRIVAQANAHLPEAEKMDVSPHVLRHTFLRKLAETRGALCPRSLWTSIRPVYLALRETGSADARGGH